MKAVEDTVERLWAISRDELLLSNNILGGAMSKRLPIEIIEWLQSVYMKQSCLLTTKHVLLRR